MVWSSPGRLVQQVLRLPLGSGSVLSKRLEKAVYPLGWKQSHSIRGRHKCLLKTCWLLGVVIVCCLHFGRLPCKPQQASWGESSPTPCSASANAMFDMGIFVFMCFWSQAIQCSLSGKGGVGKVGLQAGVQPAGIGGASGAWHHVRVCCANLGGRKRRKVECVCLPADPRGRYVFKRSLG